MAFTKVWHDRDYRLEHEGNVWQLDVAEWRDGDKGELRVYEVHGNVDQPALNEALQLLADSRGIPITQQAQRRRKGR